ncbi:hypothetical protein LPJ61_003500 [Coemansia biformis]|uniref:Uncharacterized protein n=1 Tax=Coemansia biformis TaxID=1286918 RepID=A0A9W8CXM1_9FUNG|nr:hypothetical protein LPJ61_003500 [Coemansia biformis]
MSSLVGACGASEITVSVLGAAAETWFGCAAPQWVGETSGALQALARCHPEASASALLEYMRDRLVALVGMVAAVAGDHAFVDLRRVPAAAARRRAAQYSASHIRPVAGTAGARGNGPQQAGPAAVIRLWRFTVYDALSAAQACRPSEGAELEQLLRTLEADIRSLRITNELAAPLSVAEFPPSTTDDRMAIDANQLADSDAALAAWTDVHGLWPEPVAPGFAACDAAGSGDAGIATLDPLIADSEVDALLGDDSQLFAFDNSVPLAELLGSDDPLSLQQFEESLRDEHTDSLFFDSQHSLGLLESQLSLHSGPPALGDMGWSQAGLSLGDARPAGQLPYTPPSTLRRRLEATPIVASLASCLDTPGPPQSARASQPTPATTGSGAGGRRRRASADDRGPLVLADETPTMQGHGPKRKLEFFVPETPVPVRGARHLPSGSRLAYGADTPTMRRSTSSGAAWAVPETPAAEAAQQHAPHAPGARASKAARNMTQERFRPLVMAGSSRLDPAPLERRDRRSRAMRPPRIAVAAAMPTLRTSGSTASAEDATASATMVTGDDE